MDPRQISFARRVDEAARQEYVREPDPRSLASARLALEHVTHHGLPLVFAFSKYEGDAAAHGFRCDLPTCSFKVLWGVQE